MAPVTACVTSVTLRLLGTPVGDINMQLLFHHALEGLVIELLLAHFIKDTEGRELHAPLVRVLHQPVLDDDLSQPLADESERPRLPRLSFTAFV